MWSAPGPVNKLNVGPCKTIHSENTSVRFVIGSLWFCEGTKNHSSQSPSSKVHSKPVGNWPPSSKFKKLSLFGVWFSKYASMWLMSFGLKSRHLLSFMRKIAFSNIFLAKMKIWKLWKWSIGKAKRLFFSHKLAALVSKQIMQIGFIMYKWHDLFRIKTIPLFCFNRI